jgi:hypothetical protein
VRTYAPTCEWFHALHDLLPAMLRDDAPCPTFRMLISFIEFLTFVCTDGFAGDPPIDPHATASATRRAVAQPGAERHGCGRHGSAENCCARSGIHRSPDSSATS